MFFQTFIKSRPGEAGNRAGLLDIPFRKRQEIIHILSLGSLQQRLQLRQRLTFFFGLVHCLEGMNGSARQSRPDTGGEVDGEKSLQIAGHGNDSLQCINQFPDIYRRSSRNLPCETMRSGSWWVAETTLKLLRISLPGAKRAETVFLQNTKKGLLDCGIDESPENSDSARENRTNWGKDYLGERNRSSNTLRIFSAKFLL